MGRMNTVRKSLFSNGMKIKDIGEIALIDRLKKVFRLDSSVIKGIGDDTAVVRWPKGKYMLLTCDMLIEDIHFKLGKATPFEIGWKALACSISDIAAMGGVPRYGLISIALNPNLPVCFFDGLYKGLKAIADKFNVNIVGGDANKSDKLIIDIALTGEAEKNNLVTRSGAKIGDVIFVTGTLGGSIKGRHLKFMPRVRESKQLVRNFRINSMIDISDGLVLDLNRILEASGVGACIYESTIPVSKDAKSLRGALYDGEDYELLFTMNVKEARRFFNGTFTDKIKTPVTLIGEIVGKKNGFRIIDNEGRKENLNIKGYTHF
jgi:thiamine-monophosphate kinase